MGLLSRNDSNWKHSKTTVDTAEDAYLKACQTYGENSPQAQAADEAAWTAPDNHFGTYGNPHDNLPRNN
jgi:hypothetical protein